MNETDEVMISHGYAIWKRAEAERGPITLDDIQKGAGCSISVVRKFVAEPECDVSGAAILGAGKLAKYFRVSMDTFVTLEPVKK